MKLLIVDSEPLARSALIQLCGRNAGVHVIGEAESGSAAIDAAEKLCPDLMLLDVELPDMSGFDVLRVARADSSPLAIMVATHTDYAVDAFAAGALDYLVKPVGADRFARSMERARQRCDRAVTERAQVQLGSHRRSTLPTASEHWPKLLIGERQHRMYPLDPAKIDYIESDGNYVRIRTVNLEYSSRDSIKRLSADLADRGFIRIERSLLINIRAVLYVEASGHGTFAFTLASGACLHSSATYRESILRALPLAPQAVRRPSH